MPVDSRHEEYDRMRRTWDKCRDVVEGQEAIHCGREKYLPRLDGESDKDYVARVMRSTFFNATRRTVAALRGLMFRKPPTITVPESLNPLLEDVTMSGSNLTCFVKELVTERLTVGRVGVIVDYPKVSTEGMTAAEASRFNLRPMMALYEVEDIINWSYSWVNNKNMLSMVVLAECADIPVDEFSEKDEERWRVLDLAPTNSGYVYRVRIFRKNDKDPSKFDLVEPEYFPKMNGKYLDFIPFYFVGDEYDPDDIKCPPLLDLVNINLSHYRSTSDRKHGAHKTALPQPYICGWFREDGEKELTIGNSAWSFPSPDTKVGMLEYTGQGLTTLKEEIEREEQQMAVLGARMLEQQKRAAEAAETAAIHRTGENATLADEAISISQSMVAILKVFAEWAGVDPTNITFELNRDFLPLEMDPTMLEKLVASWQQGALSKEELFYNLKQGEIIRDSTTYEQYEADIANSAPMFSSGINQLKP